MASRKPVVGGNWKMNLNRAEARALAQALAQALREPEKVDVIIFPALCHLGDVADVLKAAANPAVKLGVQDFFHQPNGAFTGEISLAMAKDLGANTVMVGHSERRHVIGESDILLNTKVRTALSQGFEVILCVGEKLEQREAGQTDAINRAQLAYGLAGVPAEQLARVIIAYEPVWAIGTGKNATPADAQAAHAAIRKALADWYSPALADAVRIQYGGSVKGSNAKELFAQPDIDGGLIGGASLKAEEFITIVKATQR